jgi:ERCC4-type nuclease
VHERASGIPDVLEALGVVVEVVPLSAGDYEVGATLLVEFFLVEGADLDDGPIAPNAIRGICLAVIARGIRLIQTENRRDSALWLRALAVRAGRPGPNERQAYAQRPRPASTREAAEAVLSAVPGISTVCARALLSQFGSVAAVAAAEQAAWLEVPGIGPDRARALRETFNFQPSEDTTATTRPPEPRPRLST